MTNRVTISVLIPCYNHRKYIGECIASIWNQNYGDVEIIAIDDGSEDDSYGLLVELSKKSPIPMMVSRHANRGATRTLNIALEKASGTHVCVIASDDLYCPRVFETLVPILKNNSDVKALYGNGRYLGSKGTSSRRVHPNRIVSRLKMPSASVLQYLLEYVPRPLLTQCAIFEREMLRAIKGWDEELLLDDWPLNIKIFDYITKHQYRHQYVDLDIANYRLHDSNLSRNEKMRSAVNHVIDKYVPAEYRTRILINEQWAAYVGMLRRKPVTAVAGLIKTFASNPNTENIKFLWDVVNTRLSLDNLS